MGHVTFIPSGDLTSVLVRVRVARSGKPLSVTLLSHGVSHGAAIYALRIARGSTYTPKIINCKPEESTLVFFIDYDPSH